MRGSLYFFLGAISLCAAGMTLSAAPINSCALNGPSGFTCNIYETDAMGNPSDISSIMLPHETTTGFIALLENPSGPVDDPTNWSNVLYFPDAGSGMATTAYFYTQGCNVAPGNTSCFPDLSVPHTAIDEDPSGTTAWMSGPNTYFLHTDATTVPEPASISLFGLALAGLGLTGRKKFVK